jgi:hypothetical protein
MTTRIVTDANGRKHITNEPLLHPPQRTWVGLTDEELLKAYGWSLASGAPNWLLEEAKQELLGALRKVEASIKEKNT